jgi:predicted DNA-binding transcriptional regulator AlpA
VKSEDLLKPSELARCLGVSRSWLYDAAKTGRVPSIRIGGPDGPLRFIPQDIDRWIDQARKERMLGEDHQAGAARVARLESRRRRVSRPMQRRPGRLL